MKEIKAVLDRMDLFLGANVQGLEEEFAAAIGAKAAVGVSSGTDALHLVLRACGVGPGDEVIVPGFTFFATCAAVIHAGATPIAVDIDPQTLLIDPALVAAAITERTRAIIPVHLYGQSAPMAPLMELAKRHGLAVIEDACQAHGAGSPAGKCGAIGTAGCFSFYYTKNVGGYGEGGMVVTSDETVAERVRLLRNQGYSPDRTEHLVVGYNSRLDEIQAAILRVKLRRLEADNQRRRRLAALYDSLLQGFELRPVAVSPGNDHAYHLYVVRSAHRDDLRAQLAAHGIGTGVHYPRPISMQPAWPAEAPGHGGLPVAHAASREVLSLPMYPELTEAQVRTVVQAIAEFEAGGGRVTMN